MNKNPKSLLNDIKMFFSSNVEVSLEELVLDNGTKLVAKMVEPGAEIFIVSDEGNVPLPIGEYTLEDGRKLSVTEEGVISEIKEAEEAPEAEPEAEAEMEAEDPATEPKKVVKTVSEETHFAELKLKDEKIAELEAEILELKKQDSEKEEVELEAIETKSEIVHSPESSTKKSIGYKFGKTKENKQNLIFKYINTNK